MDEAQLNAVRRLLALADAYHLRELTVEENGLRVTILADVPVPFPPSGPAPQPVPPHEVAYDVLEERVEPDADAEEDPAHHLLRSPMTGIFYPASAPDSPPFVVEGQAVEEGQTVGLIEAMKVFSEIPADVSGRVIRIAAESGKLLHEGDVLLVIDTTEE